MFRETTTETPVTDPVRLEALRLAVGFGQGLVTDSREVVVTAERFRQFLEGA